MTDSDRIPNPVPVTVTNWAPPVKPPYCRNTTFKTYVIDPAGSGAGKNVQICDYEPNRLRLVIIPIDAGVAILSDPPTTSPDVSSTTQPNVGAYLPSIGGEPYEFFGPDPFWLNALTTITRVTVIREYA